MPVSLVFASYSLGSGPASATALGGTPKPNTVATVTVPQIKELVALFLNDIGQKRPVRRPSAQLMQSAQVKANDLAARNYFAHTDPGGIGPNYLARAAGYTLAANYGKENAANNIESICAGTSTALGAWRAWLGSPHHKAHVLGENDFYREQCDFGFGFANVPGSKFTFYWCFHAARS